VLRGEGSVTGATGVSCESPFSVKSIFRLFLAVRIWNTNTTPQFACPFVQFSQISDLLFAHSTRSGSTLSSPPSRRLAQPKPARALCERSEGSAFRRSGIFSTCPPVAGQHRSWSLPLKSASWALATSNPQTCLPLAGAKLLRFLYLKTFLNATIFFQSSPLNRFTSLPFTRP